MPAVSGKLLAGQILAAKCQLIIYHDVGRSNKPEGWLPRPKGISFIQIANGEEGRHLQTTGSVN
jgi:hypothetical protein